MGRNYGGPELSASAHLPRLEPGLPILGEAEPHGLGFERPQDDARPAWLRYVGREVRAAMRSGVPLEGLCMYPILNHPGWDDDRHCHNGLWDYADADGNREVFEPLARELMRQQGALLHAEREETME